TRLNQHFSSHAQRALFGDAGAPRTLSGPAARRIARPPRDRAALRPSRAALWRQAERLSEFARKELVADYGRQFQDVGFREMLAHTGKASVRHVSVIGDEAFQRHPNCRHEQRAAGRHKSSIGRNDPARPFVLGNGGLTMMKWWL